MFNSCYQFHLPDKEVNYSESRLSTVLYYLQHAIKYVFVCEGLKSRQQLILYGGGYIELSAYGYTYPGAIFEGHIWCHSRPKAQLNVYMFSNGCVYVLMMCMYVFVVLFLVQGIALCFQIL